MPNDVLVVLLVILTLVIAGVGAMLIHAVRDTEDALREFNRNFEYVVRYVNACYHHEFGD